MPEQARHFDSRSVWPAQRVARWTDHGAIDFGPVRVEPGDAVRFGGQISSISIGPMTLTSIQVDDGGAVVTGLGDTDSTPRENAFIATLMISGVSRYDLDDRTVGLGPGDVLIRDLLQPWKLVFEGGVRLLALRLPYDLIAVRFSQPETLHGRFLDRTTPEAELLGAVILSAKRYADPGLPDWRAAALVDLVLGAFQTLPPSMSATASQPSTTHIERAALREILRSYADPDLSTAIIADRIGVHPRTLQRIFSARRRTIRQTILDVRLDAAAQVLCTGGYLLPSVTKLAFAHGFSDSAYFTRAFTRRFGTPPTRYARKAPDTIGPC